MKSKVSQESTTKIKRYSLSTEEKERIQNIQSVIQILALQREGLSNTLYLEIVKAKQRLGVTHKPPEGYLRDVDLDPNNYEIVVTDKIDPSQETVSEQDIELEKSVKIDIVN